MRPRDTQRAKLYRAEREALPGFQALPGQEPSVEECSTFVKKVWGSAWTKKHFRRAYAFPVPWIKDGRGTTWARGSLHHLSLPLWARTKPVMLHEIAHSLTIASETPAHGPRFAACFLALVRHFLGAEKAALFKAAFRKHHVRTRPKRKMSPAVLADLRARGHALAAANKRAKEETEGPADMPWVGPGA